MKIVSDFFHRNSEIDDWQVGNLKYFKKGNCSNPNNERSINFLDVVFKVMSIGINTRTQKTLTKYGTLFRDLKVNITSTTLTLN